MPEKPLAGEHNPYYDKYISLVTEPDLLALLEAQPAEVRAIAAGIPPERETFAYAPGKWSIRQVFGHLCDVERVFGYRAFRISRGDQTPLAGFDENTYVANSPYAGARLSALAEEFALLRGANLFMLRRVADAHWRLTGSANNSPVSVRALAFIMAGHVRHHQRGLAANYGVGARV
ncbi:MAG TPA: DinB family protein [Vicinamibacterales bacterium]|nr:DinB family protein [Vicinamibacterales bacterium]